MAATVASDLRKPNVMPDAWNILVYTGTINLNTYATGGIAIDDISDYFNTMLLVNVCSKDGYTFEYDSTNDKVKAYLAGAEVVNGTDLSSSPGACQFLAIGLKH